VAGHSGIRVFNRDAQAMFRKGRSIAVPLLAHELCLEVHALVGTSGHGVSVETLRLRLGVDWNHVTQAVGLAMHLGWVEARGLDCVGLLPDGVNRCGVQAASALDRVTVQPLPARARAGRA
jgi:hypothetical protein